MRRRKSLPELPAPDFAEGFRAGWHAAEFWADCAAEGDEDSERARERELRAPVERLTHRVMTHTSSERGQGS